jgi:PAS domain S-box-containing protein
MDKSLSLISELSLLQTIFESSPAAVMVVGKGTTIRLVNSEGEKITGYKKEELEGEKKWTDLVLSEDQEKLKNLMRMLRSGDAGLPDHLECRFVDKHGILKTVSLSGIFHKENGLVILSMINITNHKENEAMLKSAREKAESSDWLKTAFLGNLSHEIRTPMNAIVGFASLLRTDELSDEKKKLYLTQIINGSTDLLQLIEKTIILSRIDLGQLKINQRQFFVNRSLKELHEKYSRILKNSGKEEIELILETGKKDEDFVVQADRIRIIDVLNNLLENAIKFTSSGRITFGYAYLEEETDNGEDALLFYVKDTGIGISGDKAEIIFDRFVKLVDKNETVLRGAGLGLAISRDLVKLMGGDIWAESTTGDGSKFFFTIPIRKY